MATGDAQAIHLVCWSLVLAQHLVLVILGAIWISEIGLPIDALNTHQYSSEIWS